MTKVQTLYDIENQLVKALPKLGKKATDEGLRNALEMHLKETEGHVDRLEQVFDGLSETPKKLKSETVRGLVDDADWILMNIKEPAVRDAGIISAASNTENFEIAAYTIAREWAKALGENDIAELLDANLNEEIEADKKLKTMASERINAQANTVEDEDEDNDESEEDDDEDDDEE